MSAREYDAIIIGAGLYGLHAADLLAQKGGLKVAVIERDPGPFMRASYINQARVHNGYHYPRSLSTALKSAKYYERFCRDFDFAINDRFEKVYAVSGNFSYTSAENFLAFCRAANIPCEEIHPSKYFKPGSVSGCYVTQEHAFDAFRIRDYYVERLTGKAEIIYGAKITGVEKQSEKYEIILESDGAVTALSAPFVLNATYAGVNQVLRLFGFEQFRIKYEIAEICLCTTSDNIKEAGLTVMDGPFFSVMPFGLDGLHSLSSVHFTPHMTSYDSLPTFPCQKDNPQCSPEMLDNCNTCPARPKSAWAEMVQLSKKYLRDDVELYFKDALFAIKPIMKASEVDDSRPTVIRTFSEGPTFVSVLSGKINTMYDLDEVLGKL